MQISMQALGFTLTESLRRRVRRRLDFALGGRDEHIRRIVVRLSDTNGPKGGQDKCCHIQIYLNQMPNIVVKDTETDLYVAIDRAIGRAARSVTRQLGRRISRQRSAIPDNLQLSESH